MIEKIFKDAYVNPKVELTQKEYNDLVALARMKAKKIEERAREIYEKEGIVKIDFSCNIYRKMYGEIHDDVYKFQCTCDPYTIYPQDESEKSLFWIPQESREKIVKHVKSICENAFKYYFGEHMLNLNEAERLKKQQEREIKRFRILTLTGWLAAVIVILCSFFAR